MPDGPDPTNPGIGEPLNTRMAPPGPQPTGPPEQQQPPQPTPQQADMAHHALLGKAVSAMMGNSVNYQIDPQTGKTISVQQKQTPGQWGRSMVLGAMLGLSAASEGDAKGGSAGGFLGGLGRGGNAVAQHGEQQDELKRAQAQEQYKHQMEAQRNQREQEQSQREGEAFKTEQQHRTAMIAAENANTLRTQQLIKGETLTQYQKEADNGKAKVQPYIESGINANARDKTWQEVQEVVSKNSKATGWDWEQTGVKTVINPDGTTGYVPTFDAYDPTQNVKITSGFIDLLKKSKIDDSYPGTIDHLKVGQEMKPADFVALKGLYQKAYNDNLEKDKTALATSKTKAEINDYNAQALERSAQAARAAKADKQAQLLGDGLDEWNKAYTAVTKTNPDATHQDAFNKLSPKSQFAITTNLVKTIDSLEKQIKDALNQVPADQTRANELKEQQESYRTMQRQAVGAAVSKLPKAPSQGAPIPQDVMDQYIKAHPGDPDGARSAAKSAGWGKDIAQAPAAPRRTAAQDVSETKAAIVKDLKEREERLKAIPRKIKDAIDSIVQ